MARLFILLISVCVLHSCSYTHKEVNHVGYKKDQLLHTVILTLKEEVTAAEKEEVLVLLKSLEEISETNGLIVSELANTSDSRAKKDFDLILSMSFDNHTDLEKYSTNEFHLQVREELKPFLAAPPIVYDSWVRK